MQLDDYYEMNMEEFRKFRKEKTESEYLVVDVRFPEEYEEEHIPGCVLLPLAEINARLTELPADKDIIFYCHSGKRSRTASLFATSVPFFQKKYIILKAALSLLPIKPSPIILYCRFLILIQGFLSFSEPL